MFGKSKAEAQIDKDQLEFLENAQKRIKQKKKLYVHFVVFLIGAIILVIASLIIGVGEGVTFFGKDWFVFAILGWLFLFLYHAFNVFITHKFMGKAWEQKQLNKLMALQNERIEYLKQNLEKEESK
jgi:dihydrofolate reductase